MTTKTEADKTAAQLKARNEAVTKAFTKITQAVRPLLTPFSSQRYRTVIFVDHTQSEKETNMIHEFMCCFFNLTLTKNKVGYYMIYSTYDQECITRFGARLYNRLLRQIFKQTEAKEIEDCVRVNNPKDIQGFFVNRLANGENSFTTIEVEDQAS